MLTRYFSALLFALLLHACVTPSSFRSQYRADSEAQDRDRRSKNLANELEDLERRFREGGLRSPEVFRTGGCGGRFTSRSSRSTALLFPRQKPVPSEFRDAAGEHMQYHRLRNATFVFTNKRENRRYRWVTAAVYSNEFNVPDDVNPCGAPDLVCSCAGSPAMTDFEKVAYFLQRAALNRDAGRVERCNKNLVNAQNAYQDYVTYRADLEKKHEWVPSLRYKTSLAPKPMSDAELEASFAQKGRAIEDALRTNDCAKPRR